MRRISWAAVRTEGHIIGRIEVEDHAIGYVEVRCSCAPAVKLDGTELEGGRQAPDSGHREVFGALLIGSGNARDTAADIG